MRVRFEELGIDVLIMARILVKSEYQLDGLLGRTECMSNL
jgi:hypothetical protein